MEFIFIAIAAFLASGLTFFSGFGLGTLLMPIIALFFPLPIAIAATAVVHFANNIFKLLLVVKNADMRTIVRFGVPAVFASFLGALLLNELSNLPPIAEYMLFSKIITISLVKCIIGILILLFVALEFIPAFANIALSAKWLPYGGTLSGFFGGLSGNQGAFRSMFLLKTGLDKDGFVATGIVLAIMVDAARMLVYGQTFLLSHDIEWSLVAVATISAFAGALLGAKLIKKVTINFVKITVSALLVVISVGMISGII